MNLLYFRFDLINLHFQWRWRKWWTKFINSFNIHGFIILLFIDHAIDHLILTRFNIRLNDAHLELCFTRFLLNPQQFLLQFYQLRLVLIQLNLFWLFVLSYRNWNLSNGVIIGKTIDPLHKSAGRGVDHFDVWDAEISVGCYLYDFVHERSADTIKIVTTQFLDEITWISQHFLGFWPIRIIDTQYDLNQVHQIRHFLWRISQGFNFLNVLNLKTIKLFLGILNFRSHFSLFILIINFKLIHLFLQLLDFSFKHMNFIFRFSTFFLVNLGVFTDFFVLRTRRFQNWV